MRLSRLTPQQLLTKSPVLKFFYDKICKSTDINESLSGNISEYISKYNEINNLNISDIQTIYHNFIRKYNKDIINFKETGLYPAQLTPDIQVPDRVEYDVILLISCLVSPHRYMMMDLLTKNTQTGDKALFVGCGPGLEIALLQAHFSETHAFDIELNPQLRRLMPKVKFYQELFPSINAPATFDAIYLIEILEHLSDPWQLLRNCANALSLYGRLHLTTATNIPQFDHLYNFDSDHSVFEKRLKDMGLSVFENVALEHDYKDTSIKAKNHYYVFVWSNT